jgi:N-methylhydantoinase A
VVVAIDTGGTFTDAVGRRGDRVAVAKVRSTPDDPSRAVRAALDEVVSALGAARADVLIHGTTVATNALLEGRGAETWFVTNAGFEDLLAIGRQAREELYALEPSPRPLLVPRSRTVGVSGRIDGSGAELEPLDLASLDDVLRALPEGRRSWAICLLHAYRTPDHEQAVAARIRAIRPGDAVSLSSEIMPVFREVERAATTVANAFVLPVMERYLGRLEGVAGEIAIMASSGGRIPLDVARTLPAQTALSGPAGGVVAALQVAREHGVAGVVSFDMGGTSTDVALCRDTLPIRHASRVGAHPIHLPMLDIHTVGAGGGSVAEVDPGGALGVGPRSAGAEPGPACYGTGTEATVTDANVVLGRLPASTMLGGRLPIDRRRAEAAVGDIAATLGVTLERAAEGIIAVAVEKMAQAIRRISVERGEDPRELALCAFGGAGALHACALAEALGMRKVIVPPHSGLLSAVGLLRGRAVAERSQTVLDRTGPDIASVAERLVADAERALGEPVDRRAVTLELRYVGQSFELGVSYDDRDLERAAVRFAEAHGERFGYVLEGKVEPVTVRVRVEGKAPEVPGITEEATPQSALAGPASLVHLASTTWVAPGWTAQVHSSGALTMTRS